MDGLGTSGGHIEIQYEINLGETIRRWGGLGTIIGHTYIQYEKTEPQMGWDKVVWIYEQVAIPKALHHK